MGRWGTRSGRSRRSARFSALATTVAITLTAAILAVPAAASAAAAAKPSVPKASLGTPVSGLSSVGRTEVPVVDQTDHPFHATATTWPAAATATLSVSAPSAGASAGPKSAATGTPVWAQALPAQGANTQAANSQSTSTQGTNTLSANAQPAASYTAAVQPSSLATELGIDGVVWSLSPHGAGSPSDLRVGIDYKAFAQAYGGNYGSRLGLVELPACALTTPKIAGCHTATPLASQNDTAAESVSASVPVSGTVVLAATATSDQEGGSAGTYSATPLKPSDSWAVNGNSGSFTYTYPITLPAASSTLAPDAELDYDSGSVDGQTSSTQAQSSWIGDGWSSDDSYVEQSFKPCTDDPEGTASPSATQDMCYDGEVLTIALNGSATSIVDDAGTYKLQSDDGATVSKVTGSGNGSGAYQSPYWVITERDGTKYYFGRNELPGYASGDATTNSVDTEPVYSAHSGDPCYSSSGFASSVCTMAYKWHLDYVVDAHGDAMAYYYDQATNYYGEDNGAKDVSYVRDSHLDHVDYGFRDGGAYGTAPDRVVYGTSPRCVQSSCPTLSTTNSGQAGTAYPDVPYDLACASGKTCSYYGPTYFSEVRLTSITTKQYSMTAKAYEDVDTYSLAQTEPATGDGTSPTLWLSSIDHTGDDTSAGGSTGSIALPPVTFTGVDLQNRVDTANFPGLYRFRIASITNETGGVIGVTYELTNPCSEVSSITPSTNTGSCYPVYWTPNGYTAQILDWFEKYAVQQVLVSDTTGGAPAEATSYVYTGGPAWHYDDNELVKAKYRTYGQFRGYGTVQTLTGDGVNDPQTESVTTYYRGMSDDDDSTAVALTDSQGGKHDDADQLAGRPLEQSVYTGAGGTVDHSSITSYWISGATATRTRSGLPSLTANMVEPAEVWTRQALTDGGTTTWRQIETDTAYDATASDADFGLASYTYTHTVPAAAAYDQCTTSTYAPVNTSKNLVGLVSQQETDSVACSGFTEGSVPSVPNALNTLGAPTTVNRPGQVVSAKQTFYDDPTFDIAFPQSTAPTTGDATMTRTASGYASGAFVWQTGSRDTYDVYGRVEDAYDGDGHESVTSYTVNAVGLTTAESDTNALSQATSQTFDPTRGLALTATDANGLVTTEQYDALGRAVQEWDDSRAAPAPANEKTAYTVSDTSVSGIVDQQLNMKLGYSTTVTIDDSLGRTRQTQSDTDQGGRLISDQFYDSHGWVWKTNTDYWDSTTNPTLAPPVTVADVQVEDQDVYTFDGQGRTVVDTSRQKANTVATTTTVYNGDRTTVVPPTGGTVKSTVTDPLGRTSELDEYTAAPTLVTPSDTFNGIWYLTGGTTQATTYGYDGHADQGTTTDADGETWTSTYNLLGEVTAKDDPDAGTSTTQYDADGNVTQTTDARGDTVSYTYDALNRKTAEYAAPAASQDPANETASWVYDNSNDAVAGMTDPIGQVTTETSYSGGNAYTIQSAGFNATGGSLGETVTIPAAEGALAGSYTFTHTYEPNVGMPYSDAYPAAGGLPAETVGHTYLSGPLDLPSGLSGSIDGYAQGTAYDAYGNVVQQELGTGSNLAYVTDTYDPHTQKLTDSLVTGSTAASATLDEESYTYDPNGDITAQTDTRLGSSADSETQCYQYDALDQLATAWTATDKCAATPSATNDASVGDGLGAASAYWTSWTYDGSGDRTQEVDHAVPSSGTTADTITAYTYNGNGTGQAHTLTTAASTGATNSTSNYTYDADGDTTSRTTPADGAQTLAWSAGGTLTSVTGPAGTSGYVYDADGNLLLAKDPGTTTLYLPGEQIALDTATGAETGTRFIALPGGGQVVRTGAGTSYYFEITDQHDTALLYLDDTAQVPTWRQFTPYGAPRGPATTWIDGRGFLDKPTDQTTGLTDVGAREYDPLIGRFISLDPVLDTSDPLSLNGYSYTSGNPISEADPTGTASCMVGNCPTNRHVESQSWYSKSDDVAHPHYYVGDPYPVIHTGAGGTHGGSSARRAQPVLTCGMAGFVGPCDITVLRNALLQIFDPACAGYWCDEMAIGALGGSFGASLIPLAPALKAYIKAQALRNAFTRALRGPDEYPLTQYMYEHDPADLPNAVGRSAQRYFEGGDAVAAAGVGLSVLGGAVSAYGEWNQTHDPVDTALVGAGDTSANLVAGAAGNMASAWVSAALGAASEGGSIGMLAGPVGVLVGAAVGVGLSLAMSYLFNSWVNW